MTFLEEQQELTRRLHGNLSNAKFAAGVKRWLNLARDMIAGFGPWFFLLRTETVLLSANQSEYDLPDDMVRLNDQEVRLASGRKLYLVEDKDFELVVSDPSATGFPKFFRTTGVRKIQLYPIPDAAAVSKEPSVVVEYNYCFSKQLVQDSEQSGLPTYVEPAQLDLAESLGWIYLRRPQEAQLSYQKAMAALQKLNVENTEVMGLVARDFSAALRTQDWEQPQLETPRAAGGGGQ